MKYTLVTIRHAQAKDQGPDERDFDRQLTDKGRTDAAAIGERLVQQHLVPDLIIASAAKRTQQTAQILAKAAGYQIERIRTADSLYHCSIDTIEDALMQVEDQVRTCYIVGHNPGVSEFVHHIQPDHMLGDLPTCAAVAVNFEAEGWHEFPASRKRLTLFDYPKKEL